MSLATPSARKPALGFIFGTMVLSMLGFGILIPVLPALVTEFQHGDVTAASHSYGMLVGGFAVLQFIGSPILGALSDRFGRRKVLLISLAGSSIDYVIMALAPTMAWLFVARMISGFTAGLMATANAYVADVTPAEKRAHGFGVLGAAFGIGLVIGPLLGGFLGGVHVRLPFWFAAGCAALNWLYGFFVLPESLAPENRRPFSWARANPVGALRALKRFPTVRSLADAYFILIVSQTVLYSTWVLCTSYRYHWGSTEVGVSLGLAGVMSALVQAVLVRRVVPRLGEGRAIVCGMLVSIVALTLYGLASQPWMLYAIIPFGALGGISGPALQSYVTKHVPANEQGGVQGVFGGLASLAGIPGPLIGTWSFGWAISAAHSWRLPGIAFFEGALLVAVALMLVSRTLRHDARADRLEAEAPVLGEPAR